MTAMRAKMKVGYVTPYQNPQTLEVTQETVGFHAVCKPSYAGSELDEDNTYARMSPSANLQICIANPALIGKFEPGQTYYVDFSPAG